MKKKFILFALAVVACLSLFVGCSQNDSKSSRDDDDDDSYAIERKIVGFWHCIYIVEDGEDVDYSDLGIGFEAFKNGEMYNYNLFERFNEEPFTYEVTDDMEIYLTEGEGGNEYTVEFDFERIDGEKYLVWEDDSITMKFIEVDEDEFLPSSGDEPSGNDSAKGPLEGFANNTSYETFSASKTYEIFKDMKIEGSFEDCIQTLLDAGMIETAAPYDNYVGGLKADYSMEGETEKFWITINKNEDGIFNYATYYISAYESTEDLTGFHASQEVYDELWALIEDGTITNLAGIEQYFGKPFLQSKYLNSDGTNMYYYAWQNKSAYIYCMVDDNMDLVSYKIGATSLPDFYEDGDAPNAGKDKDNEKDEEEKKDDKDDEEEKDDDEDPVDIDGMDIETSYFTITALGDWQTMVVDELVQIYKDTDVLQMTVVETGAAIDYAKTYIEAAASAYDGAKVTEEKIWGITFYKTCYETAGTYQIAYAGMLDDEGRLITINISGQSEDIPEDIQTMLDSVEFKD